MVIFAVIAWLLRLLPGQIYAIIVSLRADQVLQKAVDYAINMVQGATKDRALSVDVHDEVLAKAFQYVLDNAPTWLQQWMGGLEQIANKILARLNINPNATAPDVNSTAANTAVRAKQMFGLALIEAILKALFSALGGVHQRLL